MKNSLMFDDLMTFLSGLLRRRGPTDTKRYNLIKLYVLLNAHNWKTYVEKALDVYEHLLGGTAGQYWENYSEAKPFNKEKILQKLSSRRFGDLENLVLTDEDDSISVAMNLVSAANPGICEVRLTFPSSTELKPLFIDLSADLIEMGMVLYGYARTLTKDYEPVSENKIKKTFGGVSVTAEPFSNTWFLPLALDADVMKGLYPLNLVRRSLLKDDYFGHTIDSAINVGKDMAIVEYSTSDLQLIRSADHDISRFVRV
jgi:hypothetical protein